MKIKKLFMVGTLGFILILSGCGKEITFEEAREVALKDANLSKEDVVFELEASDDDTYEFAFHTVDTYYHYEIDEDGSIEEKEKRSYEGKQTEQITNENGTPITEAEALQKAYSHFQVEESSVEQLEVKTENEDGRTVFDIEFNSGTKEYSCEIDMNTGEIISQDIDLLS